MPVPSAMTPLYRNRTTDLSRLPVSKCRSILSRLVLILSSMQAQSYLKTRSLTALISTSWTRSGQQAVSLKNNRSTSTRHLSKTIQPIRRTLSSLNRSIHSSINYKSSKRIAGAIRAPTIPSTAAIPLWANNTNTKKGKCKSQQLFRLNRSRSKLLSGARLANFDFIYLLQYFNIFLLYIKFWIIY